MSKITREDALEYHRPRALRYGVVILVRDIFYADVPDRV